MVLLGHNVNEKQPKIYIPAVLYGQVTQEVENKPDILVPKSNKRNGVRSRLVAVSSEVLYSQKENALDKHNDLPQKLFEEEINESEEIKKSLASEVLPNPARVEVRVRKTCRQRNTQEPVKSSCKAELHGSEGKGGSKDTSFTSSVSSLSIPPDLEGKVDLPVSLCTEGKTDPSSPNKQIIIYTRSRRPGELLENNSFNDWQNNTPCKWKSDNVLRTREALTGSYAVRLGSKPEKKAYLYQDMVALPGYFYEIKCNFKMPVAHARSPAIKLLWLNNNTEIIGYGIKISITTGEKPYYQYITGITTKSPRNVVYGRVYFEKHDTGVLDIDMVSFVCF